MSRRKKGAVENFLGGIGRNLGRQVDRLLGGASTVGKHVADVTYGISHKENNKWIIDANRKDVFDALMSPSIQQQAWARDVMAQKGWSENSLIAEFNKRRLP